ncbi:MAG: sugar phosphate isomerase/epimerase [Verrucomicrobiales bacterium]|jgi:sugar phosphate isomerase/epimerase|nr:sugar phosphate isomerase/epimerase [Verrucomicrobiales bacterium]
MQLNQVAAQLYTLRDYLKTPAEIAATLKKVRAIGYQAVQVSGMGEIAEDELARILQGEGLVCCATHESSDKILNEPQWVAERLQKLNCKFTAYPFPGGVDMNDFSQVTGLAKRLDAAGAVLWELGLTLAYHNHSHEFIRHQGKSVLQHLYELTAPQHLQGEIDTYWVQAGGGDPAAWCRYLKNRLPLLHMKDFAVSAQIQPMFAEIGQGNLDWRGIIQAAQQSGCQWYIVEQDTCPGDPFTSLATSFHYISEELADTR